MPDLRVASNRVGRVTAQRSYCGSKLKRRALSRNECRPISVRSKTRAVGSKSTYSSECVVQEKGADHSIITIVKVFKGAVAQSMTMAAIRLQRV